MSHLSYPSAFAQRVDRCPTTWLKLPEESATFRPVLCPDPSASSLYLVALPIPSGKVWTGAMVGRSGAHIKCLRRLTGLHGTNEFWFRTTTTDADSRWLNVKGRGEAWQVDSLIECVFFLLSTASLTWSTEEYTDRLTAHITAFQERRGTSSQEFHSLQSLQLRSPYSPTGTSSSVIVCMADLDRQRCHSMTCTHSHLSYVDHFASLCDTRPRPLASIPDTTPTFHPILALSSASPPHYVVSFPIPRIPFLLSFVVGSSGSIICCLMQATGLQRVDFWPKNSPPYTMGSPSIDWLTLRAEGEKEQVDALMEGVFWMVEEGKTILDEDVRVDALRDHLQRFKQEKAAAGQLGAYELFSLTSRHAPALSCGLPLPRSDGMVTRHVSPRTIPHELSVSNPPESPVTEAHPQQRSCQADEPCIKHWTDRGCRAQREGACPLSHVSYPDAFAQHLDESPVEWSKLPDSASRFQVFLCRESTSAFHYAVLLPIPAAKRWRGLIIGHGGAHFHCMRELCELRDHKCLWFNASPERHEAADGYVTLKGRGLAWQLDSLMECVFFLMSCCARSWSSEETVGRLRAHIIVFQERRGKQSPKFLSLRSLTPPPLIGGHLEEARPAPCYHHMIGTCSHDFCPLAHLPYRTSFAQLMDETPIQWKDIPAHGAAFHPVLCAEKDSVDSQHAVLVVFPVPSLLCGAIMGDGGLYMDGIRQLTGMRSVQCLWLENLRERSEKTDLWIYLRGRGTKEQVDCLMECVFFTAELAIHWRVKNTSTVGRVRVLEEHVESWRQRRSDAVASSNANFFSLQSAVSYAPPSTPIADALSESRMDSPSPSTAADNSFRPCMQNLDPRGCASVDCPYSHLSYGELFVTLLDTRPVYLDNIPNLSPSFHPILASLTRPSRGLPSSAPRYVVSFPLPRIPFVISCIVGNRGCVLNGCLRKISRVERLHGEYRVFPRYGVGEEPSDWLNMKAEGEKQQVDVLLKGVLWIVEKGLHLRDSQEIMEKLSEHLHAFTQSLGKESVRADEFLSLSSRGAPSVPASSSSSSSSSQSWRRGESDGVEGTPPRRELRGWRKRES